MADFEARIIGTADLNEAKQAFDTFKKQVEQPIKITFDTGGLNLAWNGLQKQAQQSGVQIGNALVQGIEKNIRTAKVGSNAMKSMFDGIVPDGKILFNGGGLESIQTTAKTVKDLKRELEAMASNGGILKSFRFGDDGKSFMADITNGANSLIKVVGTLGDILNDSGEVVGHRWQTTQSYVVDYTNAIKQAQTEAQKLAQNLDTVGTSFNTGEFTANIAKMEQGLTSIGNSVGSDLVKKASDAAAEYYRITQDIQNSLNGTMANPLQGEQLIGAYKDAEVALKTYNNAMAEVRANTEKMFAEGAGNRNANQVETWAKNNSRALKQYGAQLDELAQKMRNARTQGELSGYINEFKNLKAEITAAGLGGVSFADQIKRAFVHIGEFTGIYAITSQLRQLPREMVQEVIKIDTAMTELRKVNTASASEITNYFEQATESAYKYGQAINEVIDSTASWVRLGYSLKDATVLTDVASELGKVGAGLNVDKATEGLQAVLKGFNATAQEAKHYADVINYISDSKPIDAEGIVEGLTRSSAAMAAAGNTVEQTIALITAGTSVTQDSKSTAQALKTISMRLRGTKVELEAAGEDTDGMAESISKLRDQMLALSDVDIMINENTYKSTYDILDELSYKWDELKDKEQAKWMPMRTEMCA